MLQNEFVASRLERLITKELRQTDGSFALELPLDAVFWLVDIAGKTQTDREKRDSALDGKAHHANEGACPSC